MTYNKSTTSFMGYFKARNRIQVVSFSSCDKMANCRELVTCAEFAASDIQTHIVCARERTVPANLWLFFTHKVANPWHTANPWCHQFLSGQKSYPGDVIYFMWQNGELLRVDGLCRVCCIRRTNTHRLRMCAHVWTRLRMTLLLRKVANVGHTANPWRRGCVMK